MDGPPPELLTPRLRLRQWRETDLAPFAALNRDPAVMERFPALLDQAASDALAERCRARIAEHGWGLWATELRAARTFIGFVGLSSPAFQAPFTPCVEVGWRLARAFWGLGYAAEGARAALAFAFDRLGLDSVVSFTAVTNHKSEAVMRRLGMSREGEFDHPRLPPGHRLTRHVLYRLTRSAWSNLAPDRSPAGAPP